MYKTKLSTVLYIHTQHWFIKAKYGSIAVLYAL